MVVHMLFVATLAAAVHKGVVVQAGHTVAYAVPTALVAVLAPLLLSHAVYKHEEYCSNSHTHVPGGGKCVTAAAAAAATAAIASPPAPAATASPAPQATRIVIIVNVPCFYRCRHGWPFIPLALQQRCAGIHGCHHGLCMCMCVRVC